MSILKFRVAFLILFFVHGTLSKPVENNHNEGRGIGSTIWDWLTYPYTWWTSSNDIPESDSLIGPTTHTAFETIEIGKHNVTIWCNEQTCTTMRCDKLGCVNISCSIYDTNFKGECKEYNTLVKPEEPTSEKPANIIAKPTAQDKKNRTTTKPLESTIATLLSTESSPQQAVDERPLELEAVLSSTVTEPSNHPTQHNITLNN